MLSDTTVQRHHRTCILVPPTRNGMHPRRDFAWFKGDTRGPTLFAFVGPHGWVKPYSDGICWGVRNHPDCIAEGPRLRGIEHRDFNSNFSHLGTLGDSFQHLSKFFRPRRRRLQHRLLKSSLPSKNSLRVSNGRVVAGSFTLPFRPTRMVIRWSGVLCADSSVVEGSGFCGLGSTPGLQPTTINVHTIPAQSPE